MITMTPLGAFGMIAVMLMLVFYAKERPRQVSFSRREKVARRAG
jgi:hypothetical protein